MRALSCLCILLAALLALTNCATPRPNHIDNICRIFKQRPKWFWAAQECERKWGVPIPTQMAIIYQESHFDGKARPPRKKLLRIIPWKRPTSAYGYSQALKGTWKRYRKQSGHTLASRGAFEDAVDFIGWYAHHARKQARISKRDPRSLYLAYHEGIGGYKRGSYRKKKWLMRVANKVNYRAAVYTSQLQTCRHKLAKKPWWRKIL